MNRDRLAENKTGKMKLAVIVLGSLLTRAGVPTESVQGEWHGAIDIENDAPLRLALHIREFRGRLEATIDSIDEGESGLQVQEFLLQGSTVKFSMHSVRGSYRGTIARDGSSIDGFWTQSGLNLPLKWEPGPDPAILLEPITKTKALQEGRRYALLFHEGQLSRVWSKLSPVAQQEFVNQTKLQELRDEVGKRFGTKTGNIDEKVERVGVLQVYQRLEEFQHPPDTLQLQFAFNPAGQIAEFTLSDAQR